MIPEALNECFVFPESLTIPTELQHEYMAYQLVQNCRVSFADAMEMKETDYYKLMLFANITSARENFVREFLNNKNNE